MSEPASPIVFRLPGVSLVPVFLSAICATPLALAVPGLQLLYLIPALLALWILRARTVADPDGLAVRRLRTRHLPWSEVEGLALDGSGRVRAVTRGGARTPLPAVRARHLPLLAEHSGGRISDPGASEPDPQ